MKNKSIKRKNVMNSFIQKMTLIRISACILSISMLLFLSCKDEEIPDNDDPGFSITGISIPASLDVSKNNTITITGKGFETGDKIHFTSVTDNSKTFLTEVTSITEQSAMFMLPDGITTGNYKIAVSRGSQQLNLGSILLNIVADNNIPDKAGMTVKGIVYSDGEGIPGVVVSDGFEVTVTDENGIYYLPSEKKNGYVFISVPGNYEVPYVENLPQFYKRLSAGSKVEQKDFSLIKTDNTNHVVLAMADWHLANRNNDIEQFTTGFLSDVNATIEGYKAQGLKVYGLTLGDMSWDIYWYEKSFALPEYLVQMYKINCPVFNLMGNHDNDPYFFGDWAAEQAFKTIVGPSYYSFNLGDVHYIVLDNIDYINTGGSQGIVGNRNYNTRIVQSQMEWLVKDLAAIKDKNTPIVIGMHAPLFSRPAVDDKGDYPISFYMGGGSNFVNVLKDFTDVHILTGHSHINYAVEYESNIMEHNIGAVCATWWWTGRNGYAGNHICKDGSPGGYGVFEMKGNDIEWHYKSIGYDKNYQFRSYDVNEIHITAANYAPNSSDEKLAPYAGIFANSSNANEVLINVWGYDDDWEIIAEENGTPLDVKRINEKDPLHIISYEALRLNANSTPTSSFETHTTSHLFKVKASGVNTTIDIRVTDRFGNVYSEKMERPKNFNYLMK